MRLEDMTKTQLLNIILRKDDVEARLRAELASLKQENKQLSKECDNLKRIKNDTWMKRIIHFILFDKLSFVN